MRVPVLLAFAALSCAAQDAAPPLVNLGRLSIARVFASGRNGGQDAEGFYGVRNAFDGGSNIINGINYSSWNAGSSQDFVIVRFSQPVTVSRLAVEGSRSSWMPPPEGFTVQIRSEGSQAVFVPPAIALGGRRADEIEILGPPPAGADLSPVTPVRDPDLVQGASAEIDANQAAQKALIRTLARKQIAEMRAARSAADGATDAARKAQAWLELNRAADALAELLGGEEDLKPLAEEASALGVTV